MTDPNDRDTVRQRLTPEVASARVPSDKEPSADDGTKPGFDPFKFQRITLPPGLRVDFFRWSRESHEESVPEDTVPPNGGVVRTPRPPGFASKRGLFVGVVLAGAALIIALALATRARNRAIPVEAAPQTEANVPEAPAAAAPLVEPAVPTAPASTDGPPVTPSAVVPHQDPPRATRHVAPSKPAESKSRPHMPEPPREPATGESALDRPFSTPP